MVVPYQLRTNYQIMIDDTLTTSRPEITIEFAKIENV